MHSGETSAEPPSDDISHASRDVQVPRGVERPVEQAFRRKEADHLPDEQRIALGLAENRVDDRRRRLDRRGPPDVGDDIHLGKPAERYTDAGRPGELGEPGILLFAAVRIGIPIDREQRTRASAIPEATNWSMSRDGSSAT